MQRFIGALFILTATTGAGLLYGMELQSYLEKLLYIRHIIYLLKGELEYGNIPLGEMFANVGRRVKEPYRKWLVNLQKQVERRDETEFLKIWIHSIRCDLRELKLKPLHLAQLKELGSYLGHFDMQTESRNLQLYLETLELEIEKVREDISSKKRIGSCLGVMAGLFLIIVLI